MATAPHTADANDGRTWRLPPGRRLVNDLLAVSQRTPRIPQLRRCRLPTLTAAMEQTRRTARIGWPVLFLKAYANVCVRRPELRRVILPWPVVRIYQHPTSVARMTVSRGSGADATVVMSKTFDPASMSLHSLQEEIRGMATGTAEDVPLLAKHERFSRWPGWLRGLCWRIGENWGGPTRVFWLGTFMVTTVSHYGSVGLSPPVISNATLSFGRVGDGGEVDVTLTYDHRIIDGLAASRALAELEAELEGAVREELLSLAQQSERADAA